MRPELNDKRKITLNNSMQLYLQNVTNSRSRVRHSAGKCKSRFGLRPQSAFASPRKSLDRSHTGGILAPRTDRQLPPLRLGLLLPSSAPRDAVGNATKDVNKPRPREALRDFPLQFPAAGPSDRQGTQNSASFVQTIVCGEKEWLTIPVEQTK